MDREQAKLYIRENWEPIMQRITTPAKQNANGRRSYVCPLCSHGLHGEGITINPRSKKPGALKCFDCEFTGDILDILQQVNGYSFNDALKEAAAELGITIDPYRASAAEDFNDYDLNNLPLEPLRGSDTGKAPEDVTQAPERGSRAADSKTPADGTAAPQTGAGVNYRAYYKECRDRLTDPAAVSYLAARGISTTTAAACLLGYDPQADPAGAPGAMGDEYRPHPVPRIIIPTSWAQYVGRSIDPTTPEKYKKLNAKGSSPAIFNGQALFKHDTVFIAEGAFDALSFLEAGAAAVALNSKGNGQILLNLLQTQAAKMTARQFIICPDNEQDPKNNEKTQQQAQELCRRLQAAGFPCIVYNVAGDQHDANDALVKDRPGFEQRIAAALQAAAESAKAAAAPLGLLVYDDIVREFQEADDDFVEIKTFPEFSRTAKIKKHSTVAIAADTGGGKTSLSLNFLNSLNNDYPCIYFNLEMDKITVLRRLVAIQSGIELDRIEGYKNDPQTAAAVNVYLKAITDRKPLQIIQDVYQLEQIEEIIKASTEGRQDTTIVFIDHSLLVEISGRVAGRYERFTIISEQLRKIALRYNVILFVLLQQNRAGKADDDEQPKNSSLKESGSWENDATHICFLWYDPQVKRKKLLLTKNRGGTAGEFVLNYWSKTQTYTEAKDQPAARTTGPAGKGQKMSKRDKAREKLQAAYNNAVVATEGRPTLRAMAEAADVTTATVKGWIREYGGCTVNGESVDPAGLDTEIEYTGFIRLTPADDVPFDDPPQAAAVRF